MQSLFNLLLRPTQTVEKKYYSTLEPAEFKHILNWELRRGAFAISNINIKGKVHDHNNSFKFTPKYGKVGQLNLTSDIEFEVFWVYGDGTFKKGDVNPTEVQINVKTNKRHSFFYCICLIAFLICLTLIPFKSSAIVFSIVSLIAFLITGVSITRRKKTLIKELENIVPLIEQ